MWVIVDAEPGAGVYLGFKDGVTPEVYDAALAEGTLADLLAFYPASTGDVFWVPGGRVHAIGQGCLLYEVQQNSNTTYRLHDWGRVGVDGNPRELHLAKGREVIAWDDTDPARMAAEPLPASFNDARGEQLLTCPYFSLERWCIEAGSAFPTPAAGHVVLFVVEGSWRLPEEEVGSLRSVLYPSGTSDWGVAGPDGATVLLTRFD